MSLSAITRGFNSPFPAKGTSLLGQLGALFGPSGTSFPVVRNRKACSSNILPSVGGCRQGGRVLPYLVILPLGPKPCVTKGCGPRAMYCACLKFKDRPAFSSFKVRSNLLRDGLT